MHLEGFLRSGHRPLHLHQLTLLLLRASPFPAVSGPQEKTGRVCVKCVESSSGHATPKAYNLLLRDSPPTSSWAEGTRAQVRRSRMHSPGSLVTMPKNKTKKTTPTLHFLLLRCRQGLRQATSTRETVKRTRPASRPEKGRN